MFEQNGVFLEQPSIAKRGRPTWMVTASIADVIIDDEPETTNPSGSSRQPSARRWEPIPLYIEAPRPGERPPHGADADEARPERTRGVIIIGGDDEEEDNPSHMIVLDMA